MGSGVWAKAVRVSCGCDATPTTGTEICAGNGRTKTVPIAAGRSGLWQQDIEQSAKPEVF